MWESGTKRSVYIRMARINLKFACRQGLINIWPHSTRPLCVFVSRRTASNNMQAASSFYLSEKLPLAARAEPSLCRKALKYSRDKTFWIYERRRRALLLSCRSPLCAHVIINRGSVQPGAFRLICLESVYDPVVYCIYARAQTCNSATGWKLHCAL